MDNGALTSFAHIMGHAALKVALGVTQSRHYRRLIEGAKTPREVQAALLRRILATNAETDFGTRHGFSRIHTVDAYRRAVPIQTYEELRPFIERQELTGEPCLTREPPVYYHRTSGTVGAPKNVPVTATGFKHIKRHQHLSAYAQSRGSALFKGMVFGIGGQAIEGKMAGGTPFGSASGLLYQTQSRFVRSRYVLPPELSDIEDYEARYLAMAIHGLSDPAVTCLASANPSTFLRLLSVINQNPDVILASVASGRLPDVGLPHAAFANRLRPRPIRAARLADRLNATARLTYADIWPDLRGVLTWTGGSCGVPLRRLSGLLPAGVTIIEAGYLASEVRGTVNVDVRRNLCLPTLFHTFFEFADRQDWESGAAELQGLHELEEGREYYVFVTTEDGLYRYDMNDVVRVSGKLHETPALEFVQKGKGITNVTGEKLHEAQVLDAVLGALDTRNVSSEFFIMLADREAAGYTLFVEARAPRGDTDFAHDLDGRLRALNLEYDAKRASGRLAPLNVRWLRNGTGTRYRSSCVARGQRDAQFKYLHLQYAHECPFDFDGFVEPG